MIDRRRIRPGLVLFLAAILVGSTLLFAQGSIPAQEAEDYPDNRDEAAVINVGTDGTTIQGRLTSGDVDWVRIPVERGDVLNVSPDGEVRSVAVYFMTFNRTGQFVERRREVPKSGEPPGVTNVTAVTDGDVLIRVSSTTSTVHRWVLDLEMAEASDEWPAPVRVDPGAYTGRINSPDDTDELNLLADGRDVVKVKLTKDSGTDVRLRSITFPDGELDGLGNRSGESIERRILIEKGAGAGNVSFPVIQGRDALAPRWSMVLSRFVDADQWPRQPREVYSGTTVEGAIDAPEDRDWVAIPMMAGDNISLRLFAGDGQVRMAVQPPGEDRPTWGRAPADSMVPIEVTANETGFARIKIASSDVRGQAIDWELVVEGNRPTSFWIAQRGQPAGPDTTLPPLSERPVEKSEGLLDSVIPDIPSSVTIPLPNLRSLVAVGVGVLIGVGVAIFWRRRRE